MFNIMSARAASKYSTWKSVKESRVFIDVENDANRAETFFSTLNNIANKFLSAMIYHHFIYSLLFLSLLWNNFLVFYRYE